jgi:hypothetical protein
MGILVPGRPGPRRDRVWVVAGSWEAEERQGAGGIPVAQRSVFAVVATPRSRSTADGRGAGHRLRPLQPARQGLPHRQDRPAHQLRQRRHPHHHPPIHPRSRSANRALVDLLGRIAARKHATPRPRSPSPGCWLSGPGSCRSPAPAGWNAWRRISAPSTSNSPLTISVRLRTPLTDHRPGDPVSRTPRATDRPLRGTASRNG